MDMVGQQSGLWKMWDEGRMLCHVSPQQTEMSFSATRPRSAAAAVCFPCTAPVNSFTCRLPFQKESGIISTLTISRAHTFVYRSSAWTMIHPLILKGRCLFPFIYMTYILFSRCFSIWHIKLDHFSGVTEALCWHHIYPNSVSLEMLRSWLEVKVMFYGFNIKGFWNRLSCRHGLRWQWADQTSIMKWVLVPV